MRNSEYAHERRPSSIHQDMTALHDRINRVINTQAFEQCLEAEGVDFIEFQCTWGKLSKGDFEALPESYRKAILAGEAELTTAGELMLA